MVGTHVTYILECADGTFYVGATNNLEKRLKQHNGAKSGAHYTKIRRPVVLRYAESFTTLGEARAREAALKRLSRPEKLALVRGKEVLEYRHYAVRLNIPMAKGNNSQKKEAKKPKKDKKKK